MILGLIITSPYKVPFLQQRYRDESYCCASAPINALSGIDSDCYCSIGTKSTPVLFAAKKIYSSAKRVMKKSFASLNICSRLRGDKVMRTLVNTPAMLGNNN
jgi:hypothetical protein